MRSSQGSGISSELLTATPDAADATERFPRSRRLCRGDQFKRVFADSGRLDSAGFLVRVRSNEQSYARLGLAISKRYCPRAVDRNKLKRIARESFRSRAGALPAVDIVVLCNPKARHLTNRELFAGLERMWRKVMGRQWLES